MPGIGFRFDIGHEAAWVPDFRAQRRAANGVGHWRGARRDPNRTEPRRNLRHGRVQSWVANHRAGMFTRIDPATNEPVATIEVGPAGPSGPQAIVASENACGSAYRTSEKSW